MKRLPSVSELRQRLITVWFTFGLRAKMTVIVVIGTIALLGVFAYLGTAALNESTQGTMQERVLLAQTNARHIDYVIANIDDALTDIAGQRVWTAGFPDDASLENAYERLSVYATRVYFLGTDAHSIAAYPPISTSINFEDFATVAAALNGQAFGISRYRRPLGPLGSSTIAVSPIRMESGQVIGALAASIDLTEPTISTFTEPIGLGKTGYMDLVDLNGSILVSTRRERIGRDSDHGQELAGMIREHRQVVSACHNCHVPELQPTPEREVLAFAPLERAQWGVAIRQTEDEVFSTTRQLQTRIFALFAIALAGALGLVYLTTRSVIDPVRALTLASQRIAAGDLATPVVTFGRDEVSTLARSFDTMRIRLKDSVREIQEWNRTLELRVAEGTTANRKASEDIQRLYAELQRREQMRSELLSRLISVQEEERKRISRELHDETCQILTALEYALDNTAETLTSEEIPPQLERMREMTEDALEGVQRIMFDLRPSMLDHLGLTPALRWYAETRLNGSGTEVRIRELGEPLRLSPDVETALYRVVQEAINNIARHSHARNAELAFEFTNERVEIRVSDDGNGFDMASLKFAPNGKQGLGLIGMRERMSLIGGEFHLESKPGLGTVIGLVVPFQEGAHGKNTCSGC